MTEIAGPQSDRPMIISDELPIGEESCREVFEALRKLKLKRFPDGSGSLSGTLEAPLLRALFRWEAKMLRDDADAMGPDGRLTRSHGKRRHDAFASLLHEVAEERARIHKASEVAGRRPS